MHFMTCGARADINYLMEHTEEKDLYLSVKPSGAQVRQVFSLVQSSRPRRCLYDHRRRRSCGGERLFGREPEAKHRVTEGKMNDTLQGCF